MNVGERVWVTDASSRYPWKRQLIGSSGVVQEVTDKAVAVNVKISEDSDWPIWFAKDCVKGATK